MILTLGKEAVAGRLLVDGLHHPSQLYSSHLLSVAVYCQRQEHFFIEGVASKAHYGPKFDVQFVK